MARFINNPLFINTVLLGGTPQEKVMAAAQAGFDQVELWRQDLEAHAGDAKNLAGLLDTQQTGLTDYQVLLDFTGAPDKRRDAKRQEALQMLETAVLLGATTLLTPASTDAECIAGREEEDLRWLSREAGKRGVRIAFEAMAWSTHINTLPAAWKLVQKIDEPNLGLVVDAFHIFVRNRTVADLAGIPAEKIFLVQLSDLATLPSQDRLVDIARHQRLLPGQGNFPLYTLLNALHAQGYQGPLGLEVFNDRYHQQPPTEVAAEAFHALKRQCAATS
ncbi:sugar phosphate isomerase/epimerase family protein [Erwinia pyri]|uniref:Sugar phosphate isomerase/epimerase family protein n=1 Tax=Erwinia pyri TaxID=3062598 RepID=A0AA50DFF0_9GAMM|nr:sugar phosphate isomerase/epimerase family protein [Erwinia sp. DE2]WLS77164.1 sugar phosphate isomerase/epimerase family protein [Erwinia sp. DE2]